MNFLKQQLRSKTKQRALLALLGLVIVIGLFSFISPAIGADDALPASTGGGDSLPDEYSADVITVAKDSKVNWFAILIGSFIMWLIKLLGGLLLWVMDMVVTVFQYNNFLHSQAVTIGWPLVRDLCNMFFVVILLIMAFSTILKVQAYHYKGLLLKFVLMAILINFSKTILGFMIDFAQVIMLTFVNAFKEAMLINLGNGFSIKSMLEINNITPGEGDEVSAATFIGALLLGLILTVVALFTMVVYLVVLLYRIITLWVLVILSPIAFLGGAFPGLRKYSSQFWEKFWSILGLGVSLAFFMWLSMSILSLAGSDDKSQIVQEFTYEKSKTLGGMENQEAGYTVTISEVSKSDYLFTYVVSIALLLMALQFAQQAGGFAGKFAGMASNKLNEIGTKAAKIGLLPATGLWKGAKASASFAGKEALAAAGLPTVTELKKGWEAAKARRDRIRVRKRENVAGKRQGILGALGTPEHLAYEFGTLPKLIRKMAGKEGGIFGGKEKKAEEQLDGAEENLNEKTAESKMQGTVVRGREVAGEEEMKKERHRYTTEQKKKRITATSIARSRNLTNVKEREGVEDAIIQVQLEGEDKPTWVVAEDYYRTEASKGGLTNPNEIDKFTREQLEQVDQQKASVTMANESEIIRERVAEKVGRRSEGDLSGRGEKQIKDELARIADRKEMIRHAHIQTGLQQADKKEIVLNQEIDELDKTIKKTFDPRQKKAYEEEKKFKIAERDEVRERRAKLKSSVTPEEIAANEEMHKDDLAQLEVEERVLAKEKGIASFTSDDRKKQQEAVQGASVEFDAAQSDYREKRAPYNFAMRRDLRKGIQEEQSTMLTDNWEELVGIYEDATRDGDTIRAAAAYYQVTKYGNENEFQNWFSHGSNAVGMRGMIEGDLVGKGGMAPEVGKILASDMSYIGENIGHWGVARSIGMKNGRLRWQPESWRNMEVLAEMRKLDFEGVMRKFNRLAFFNETPEGYTPQERMANFQRTRDRTGEPMDYFKAYYMDNWKLMDSLIERGRVQPSLRVNIADPGTIAALRDLNQFVSPHETSLLRNRSFNQGLNLWSLVGSKEIAAGDPFKLLKDIQRQGQRTQRMVRKMGRP